MTETTGNIAGLRVLIVEGEALIAMDIEDMLLDIQCVPVGPASTIEHALDVIRTDEGLDLVLLDMNLHGRTVTPIATELVEKGIAFVLVTGYARRDDDAPVLARAPRLTKPFSSTTLSDTLTKTVQTLRMAASIK